MAKAVLNSKVIKPDKAVLIIDKIGIIGEALAEEFSKDFYVILLSSRNSQISNDRIHRIIFKGNIPKVPQNKYSKMFLIDDGSSITRQSSTSFVKEAKRINSDFYFLGSIRNHDIKNSNEIIKIYEKAKVLIFGDLFDKDYYFDPDSSITKFITSASNNKLINVPNEGLSLSFPIAFRDTIKLIIKASYMEINERIILLFYKNPITDISLAHIFQRIDPNINVDYIKEQNSNNIYIPEGAEFAISKYDIKKKIEDLDIQKERKVGISKKRKNKTDLKLFKLFVFTLFIFLFIFSLPLITTVTYRELGKIQLKQSFELAKENKFDESLQTINRANSFFLISRNANIVLDKQLVFLNIDNLKIFNNNFQINDDSINSATNLFRGLNYLNNIYYGKSLNPSEDFDNGINSLKEAYLGSQEKEKMINEFGDYADEFNDLQTFVEFVGITSDVLPDVFGFNGEKKYLILFQDSTKLTSGGGEIDAIGIVKVNNGEIEKFDLISNKNLNKSLKAKVEPPYFIRRYLKDDNLSFDESNYDPDFVTNAISATSLYSLLKNEEVDGVVGVDVYFIKQMLSVVGPVNIKAINKEVNSENLVEMLAENGNDEIYLEIVNELRNSFKNKQRVSTADFFSSIVELMSEKHLMFAFKDSEIQNVFQKNKLSGSLEESRINSDEGINDFVGISEHSLDSNNFSYYISRSFEKNNIINDKGILESNLKIYFKNSNEMSNASSKTYKFYFQLILPSGSILKSISIGGQNKIIYQAEINPLLYDNEDFKNKDGVEIEQREVGDKTILGFIVSVAPDSVQAVRIGYELPFSIYNKKLPTNYSLIVYKQSGIESFPFILSFSKNSDFVILPKDPISKDIRKDEEFNLVISKK